LGHLLTRSGLTYPEVSSKVYHDSFCQLGSSISLAWVIYFEAFYLHVVTQTFYENINNSTGHRISLINNTTFTHVLRVSTAPHTTASSAQFT